MRIGELVAVLRVDSNEFVRGLADAHKRLQATKSAVGDVTDGVARFGDTLASIGKLPAAISTLGPVLAGAVSVVGTATGALNILPGVLLAGAGAMATFKLATKGVSDAIKETDPEKLNEALQDLAPSAREFVLAAKEVAPAWKAVQQQVQQNFFDHTAVTLKALSRDYLPGVSAGLGEIAQQMNQGLRLSGSILADPTPVGNLRMILGDTAIASGELSGALGDVVRGLLAMGVTGTSFLPGLVAGAKDAARAFREWAESAEGAATIHDRISAGLSVIGDLALVIGNVGSLISAVFAGANVDGASFVATLAQLTGQAAEWAASAEGQRTIAEVWNLLAAVSGALWTVLSAVGQVVVVIAGWFAALPAPVQSAIASFLGWAFAAGLVIAKVAPLVGSLITFGGAIKTYGPTLLTAAKAVGTFGGKLGWLAVQALMMAGRMAAAWLIAMGPVGWVIAAVIALVTLIVVYWDEIKAFTIAAWTAVVAFLAGVWDSIVAGATAAWSWLTTTISTAIDSAIAFLMSLPMRAAYALGYLAGLVYTGALAAWSWLTDTLPGLIESAITWLLGLPGRALAALVALGAMVLSGATAAWSWLVTTATDLGSQALAFIGSLPGRVGGFLASLPGVVMNAASNAWTSFLSSTRSLGEQAMAFIRALPGRITGFFAGAGSWLVNAGRDIVTGLWNGLKAMAQAVLDWIANLGRQISAGFAAAVGIRSPSKVFASHGENMGLGAIVGLDRIGPRMVADAAAIADQMSRAAMPDVGRIASGLTAQLPGDAWLSRTPDPDPRRGGDGPSVTVNVHNPLPETTSDSINRRARSLAILGSD